MGRQYVVLGAAMLASAATAASAQTDFGVRTFAQLRPAVITIGEGRSEVRHVAFPGIAEIARVSARWGLVTSTIRSAEHNRAVGGVPNSYHLRGRAIDLVRRPGVSHAQVAMALRRMGYSLAESLDEGDHSHFAFNGDDVPYTLARAEERRGESLRREAMAQTSQLRFVVPHEPEGDEPQGASASTVVIASRLSH